MIYPLSFTSLSALVTDKKERQKFRMGSLISCFIPAAFLLSTAVQHMRKSSLVRPKVQLAEQQMLRETRYLEIYPSLEMHSQVLELSHLRTTRWYLFKCLFSLIGTIRFKMEFIVLWHYAQISEVCQSSCYFIFIKCNSLTCIICAWQVASSSTWDWSVVGFGVGHFFCFLSYPDTGIVFNINRFQHSGNLSILQLYK